MGKTHRAIGLMSGTSMDGIDVALLDTDGEEVVRRGPTRTLTYSDAFRTRLREASSLATVLRSRSERPPLLAATEQELTLLHSDAVHRLLSEQKTAAKDVDVVGFHGQTIVHRRGAAAPGRAGAFTVQLGDGALLARLTGIDVVFDMRAADASAGGEGAPLAPAYHRALAAKLPERPVAFLNIGGVANVTWIGAKGELLAFDTGPGNAMVDDWVHRTRGIPCDIDGKLAGAGRAHEAIVTEYLRHSYFGERPPKSLDRNAFPLDLVRVLSPEDGAATLTAFAAAAIARAREHFSEEPALWVVCGGGRRNKTLMARIAERMEAAVAPAEAIGIDGDAVEAEAWAYLAVRSLRKLPLTYPGTTGVPRPMPGGVLARKEA